MAAQFTQIASKRTPNNGLLAQSSRKLFLTYYIPVSLKLFYRIFHGKTPPVRLLKTVDLCLEMSSDFKYNFCFVVEEIFELGNATKSRCLGVRVEAHANGKSLGSIRGRQATVDALIGNEHYPTIRRLRISIRLSVTKTEQFRTQSENWTLYLLTHMIVFRLQLPSSSSHKNQNLQTDRIASTPLKSKTSSMAPPSPLPAPPRSHVPYILAFQQWLIFALLHGKLKKLCLWKHFGGYLP